MQDGEGHACSMGKIRGAWRMGWGNMGSCHAASGRLLVGGGWLRAGAVAICVRGWASPWPLWATITVTSLAAGTVGLSAPCVASAALLKRIPEGSH